MLIFNWFTNQLKALGLPDKINKFGGVKLAIFRETWFNFKKIISKQLHHAGGNCKGDACGHATFRFTVVGVAGCRKKH